MKQKKQFKCTHDGCGKRYTSGQALSRHRKQKHPKILKRRCKKHKDKFGKGLILNYVLSLANKKTKETPVLSKRKCKVREKLHIDQSLV